MVKQYHIIYHFSVTKETSPHNILLLPTNHETTDLARPQKKPLLSDSIENFFCTVVYLKNTVNNIQRVV